MVKGKNAVIYGVSDSLGGAVAKAFAEHGGTVYVTFFHVEKAEKIAREITDAGGIAIAAQVDALDQKAVEAHLAQITAAGKTIDISFNLIDTKAAHNVPIAEMQMEDFLRPIDISMRTQFITNTAAARIMIRQRSGVILSLTATPAGIGYPMVGGFGPACSAMEALTRGLASELGPHGVRVVTIRSAGSLDSRPFREVVESSDPNAPDIFADMKADTMLKEMPKMIDIANTAVFIASEMGRMITGVVVDVTAGTTAALNYRTSKG